MRHKVGKRKLNKPTDQRMALLKNQVQALFMHERLVTTEARAKEVRSLAEKLITRAKVDNLGQPPAGREIHPEAADADGNQIQIRRAQSAQSLCGAQKRDGEKVARHGASRTRDSGETLHRHRPALRGPRQRRPRWQWRLHPHREAARPSRRRRANSRAVVSRVIVRLCVH